MTIALNGTSGITNVNGTAAAPAITGTDTDSGMYFGTNIVALATNGTNAVYVDASQNVGIGTTSTTPRFSVVSTSGTYSGGIRVNGNSSGNNQSGMYIVGCQSTAKYNFLIGSQFNVDNAFEITPSTAVNGTTFSTPAMVVDYSGNSIFGKTTTAIGTVGAYIASAGRITISNATTTSADDGLQIYSTGAANYRFWVGMDGTIHAVSTSIVAISDASLKTNVKDLETGLTEVMALKPRRFDWINGDGTNVAGFIAQELEQVLPELVVESKYSQDEQGNQITKKSIKMGDILPTLVKAVQEQQALITSLTDRIAALEAK